MQFAALQLLQQQQMLTEALVDDSSEEDEEEDEEYISQCDLIHHRHRQAVAQPIRPVWLLLQVIYHHVCLASLQIDSETHSFFSLLMSSPHERLHVRGTSAPGSVQPCLLSLAYHARHALEIWRLISLFCFYSCVSIQPQRRADALMTTIT